MLLQVPHVDECRALVRISLQRIGAPASGMLQLEVRVTPPEQPSVDSWVDACDLANTGNSRTPRLPALQAELSSIACVVVDAAAAHARAEAGRADASLGRATDFRRVGLATPFPLHIVARALLPEPRPSSKVLAASTMLPRLESLERLAGASEAASASAGAAVPSTAAVVLACMEATAAPPPWTEELQRARLHDLLRVRVVVLLRAALDKASTVVAVLRRMRSGGGILPAAAAAMGLMTTQAAERGERGERAERWPGGTGLGTRRHGMGPPGPHSNVPSGYGYRQGVGPPVPTSVGVPGEAPPLPRLFRVHS